MNFEFLVKFLIDSPYKRMIFLKIKLVTEVPINFLNHLKFGLKAYQRRIVSLLTDIILGFSGYSQTNANRWAGFTRLSVTTAVQVVL